MAINFELAGRFAHELLEAQTASQGTSSSECFQIFEKYVRLLNFDGAVFSFVPEVLQNTEITLPSVIECSDEFTGTFLKHYVEDPSLSSNDFTIRQIRENNLNMKDWGFYYKYEQLSDGEKKVIEVAKHDHRINNAISIPTVKKEIAIAGASFFSEEKDDRFERLKKENLETLEHCTRLFNKLVMPEQQMQDQMARSVLKELNSTTIDILRHLAQDRVMKQVDDIGYTYRYGLKVRDIAKAKLGMKTTEKLMYTVGLLNIFDYINRHPEDDFHK